MFVQKLINEIKAYCLEKEFDTKDQLKEALLGIRPFDLGLLGLEGDYDVSNKQFVDFLMTSPYESICISAANILRKKEVGRLRSIHYQAAQDYLAQLWCDSQKSPIRVPSSNTLPRRDYCETIINGIQTIANHIDEGIKLGLSMEEILLHDEICGILRKSYDETVVSAAKRLCMVMDESKDFQVEDYNDCLEFDDQSPTFLLSYENAMNHFMSEVTHIRDTEFGKGWLEDNSLEMLYISAHAQRRLTEKYEGK